MGHSSVIDRQANISGYSHDPNEVSRRVERLALERLARGIQEEVAGRGEAAADHDELRVEDVHEAPDRDA